MRYISDIEFKKRVFDLTKKLHDTKDTKELAKIEEEIRALKKERLNSEMQERFETMKRR